MIPSASKGPDRSHGQDQDQNQGQDQSHGHGQRLLIVEDDRDFRATLLQTLKKAGYSAEAAPGTVAAWSWLQREKPDLILLDLVLPDGSGLELCRRIRSDRRLLQVPILMLTALDSEQQKVEGFLHGSDDYMVKPMQFAELLWRIRAILRRSGGSAPSCLRLGPLEIYPDSFQVQVDGEAVALGRKEFQLLLVLAEASGRICGRNALLDHLWPERIDIGPRVLDTTVRRLRAGLGRGGDLIRTHRGMGYSLRVQADS